MSAPADKKIKTWQRAGAVVLALSVWQAASWAVGSALLLPGPVTVLGRLCALAVTAVFRRAVAFSFCRIAGGFALALVLAFVLALAAGRWPVVEMLLRPYVLAIKAVPVASFIILALIWLSSRTLPLFIAALMVFPPVYLNVLEGIRRTDASLLEMARVFRVPFSRTLRGVYLPQVLPYFRSAVSAALGLCWKAGTAAEVIARLPEGSVAGIGVTNQRETTILWDKATGEPVYNAIVWQCRRTAELCEDLKRRGLEERIRAATGLLIDAYFSGSKIRWILDNVPGVRQRAERGEVLFGTVETWLIWQLTGQHVTDYANASRTMLFDIHRLAWDEELCGILGVPTAMLPQPVPNSAVYGTVQPSIPGLESLAGVPVCGAAGDQQSALFGQTCFTPGEAKNTYGTGCFTLMNVGEKPVRSRAGLLTSVAWQVDGKTTYALEGSVFNAGSTIQWLRDELGIISSAPEIDVLAATVPDSGGVVVVPAFTGLGAPYWDMYARGAILGVTRGTGRAHIARAVLSCIAAQVTDLMLAMRQDAGCDIALLRADGGASVSDVLLQMQADLLRIPVDRPEMVETTAFGAAALAGLSCGVWRDMEELKALRRSQRMFLPERPQADCDAYYRLWKRAVSRAADWIEH